MFQETALQLDEQIQRAVEEFCEPQHVRTVIRTAVFKTLAAVLDEEVRNFYMKGEGRAVIRAAVEKKLKDDETYTVLDREQDEERD
jgi:hypothetical protein